MNILKPTEYLTSKGFSKCERVVVEQLSTSEHSLFPRLSIVFAHVLHFCQCLFSKRFLVHLTEQKLKPPDSGSDFVQFSGQGNKRYLDFINCTIGLLHNRERKYKVIAVNYHY